MLHAKGSALEQNLFCYSYLFSAVFISIGIDIC